MFSYTNKISILLVAAALIITPTYQKNIMKGKDVKTSGEDITSSAPPLPLIDDFSWMLGTWYECRESSLMTFPQGTVGNPKHVNHNDECSGKKFGDVTQVVGLEDSVSNQIFELTAIRLNHCFFWNLATEPLDFGPPHFMPSGPNCPNATLPNQNRAGVGNVMIKYGAHGVGSYAMGDHFSFKTDWIQYKDVDDNWITPEKHNIKEDTDYWKCHKVSGANGIVCDVRLTEWRPSDGMGGDSYQFEDFGSVYLVKDMGDCEYCPAKKSPGKLRK